MKKPILEQKDFLNPEETIRLFNLSRRKFYRFLKDEKGWDSQLCMEIEN